MESRDKITEPIHASAAEREHSVANESDSDKRWIPGNNAAAPLAVAKCECPPGCVGLPCCTQESA